MAVPDAAVAHYKSVQRFQALAVLSAEALWSEVSLADLSDSWSEQAALLVPALTGLQARAASAGSSYGAATLAQQGLYEAPKRFVDPKAFGGFASDGRTLEGLLYSSVPYVKNLIGAGMAPAEALASGRSHLSGAVRTQVADAARGAAGVDISTRTNVGYVRMLNPPSCSRCSILAGKYYAWNAGFSRHPRCFPEGTTVSGPASEAASRRWYEGEMVTLSTASGEKLSLTGNHPILTSRGWVPANLVRESDEVFRSTRTKGATALVIPDHNQVPTLIEDVWRALSVNGLDTMPTTAEDFHGDGQEGEVDVVYADSALGDWGGTSVHEHLQEQRLAAGRKLAFGFELEGSPVLIDGGRSALAGGAVGSGSLMLPVSGAHLSIAGSSSFAHSAPFNPGGFESIGYDATGNAVLLGEGVFTRSGKVRGDDFLTRNDALPTRWDAPGLSFDMETADGYARVGRNLIERMSGQVQPDRVVKAVSAEFRGHVYSVTSSEGWHSANSLIVSNCDCIHVPSTEKAISGAGSEGLLHDPYAYFESLSESEQDRLYTKASAQAIRDGSDIFQVVNSRRGMKPGGLITTEGTSKRGNYGRGRAPRLTPEGIYSQGKSHEETLRLLEKNGYILPGGQDPAGVLRGARDGYGQMGRGGTRIGARQAVERARATGVRDPATRATMTAAELRYFDAQMNWDAVSRGRNPFGRGKLTPELAAAVEFDFRRVVLGGDVAAKLTVRRHMAGN